VKVAIAVFVPDQDVARTHVAVHARDGSGREISPQAQALVSDTVSSLVELLRGLGGESSAAAAELEVSCVLESR
jgi:hypothetical protein